MLTPPALTTIPSHGSDFSRHTTTLAEEAREFALMDTNKDGVLSREEVMEAAGTFYMSPAEASALFDKLDANGDGVL